MIYKPGERETKAVKKDATNPLWSERQDQLFKKRWLDFLAFKHSTSIG